MLTNCLKNRRSPKSHLLLTCSTSAKRLEALRTNQMSNRSERDTRRDLFRSKLRQTLKTRFLRNCKRDRRLDKDRNLCSRTFLFQSFLAHLKREIFLRRFSKSISLLFQRTTSPGPVKLRLANKRVKLRLLELPALFLVPQRPMVTNYLLFQP